MSRIATNRFSLPALLAVAVMVMVMVMMIRIAMAVSVVMMTETGTRKGKKEMHGNTLSIVKTSKTSLTMAQEEV